MRDEVMAQMQKEAGMSSKTLQTAAKVRHCAPELLVSLYDT